MASSINSVNDAGAIATDSPDGEGLFGKLSAELKNDIFELALVAPGSIEISRKGAYVHLYSPEGEPINRKKLEHSVRAVVLVPKGKAVKRLPVGGVVGSGLLRTSTSIKAVALPMFFGLNQFRFAREKAVEHFFATAPVARNLVRHIDIWATNIRQLDLRALETNTAVEFLKITIAHSGNKSSRPASFVDVWWGIADFVRGGTSPQQEKQRFDLITFDIKGAPVGQSPWNKGCSDPLDENAHERFKDKLLRAWARNICYEDSQKYSFMPEGVSWMLID